jgi:OOP family OmpA-OmpF porin
MTLRRLLLAASMLAGPFALAVGGSGTASAQPISGIYVGAGAGVNLMEDQLVRPSPALGTPGMKMRYDPGFTGLGSVGYAFGNGVRVELEGNYRQNDVGRMPGTALPTSASGTQRNYGVMVNALFDMDIGVRWLFPYVGGGIGYEWTNWSNVQAVSTNGATRLDVSGTYGNFAYQAIGGLAFPIPHMPGLSVTAEYRFMGILGPQSFDGTLTSPAGVAQGNYDIRNNYNHSVLLGVRYAFNVAPPPVPAAPAAAPVAQPARSYLVFFDWDSARLNARAHQIIGEAAATIPKVEHTTIEVNGYTDTSGSPKYNMALSMRRANAVAAELVRLGVPKQEIAIKGFGETHLLVQTGPNVREPQNRRVEILIR